ncbi:hypothetical protein [Mucilaginibacter paludis]|uniref:Uncharacterized protein n=1 Tax=Mucilaginibacter paludis DSM 18603 TaxID=714943 RepID=H1Y086_9SPHI|nr:hypothetical protein [Mucilaginibacter paludis]EHQ27995.1 hypothetical protein Mucpa_3903 [Mucilaginibacter paludis DSM 18603]
MKKVCCMIALAAITLGSVYAEAPVKNSSSVTVGDTTKKVKVKKHVMKKKVKKDTTTTKM